MFYSNEQHNAETESAIDLVEEDIKRNSDDIVQCFDGQFFLIFLSLLKVVISIQL